MKKIILIILLLISCPITVNAISAETAIVMDMDSGRVLFQKNIHKQKLIASTTKIMTALVTIENIDLKKQVTVDESVLKAYGSAIYIEVGENISILDLLYGLILRSGNDAAIVIAKEVSSSMDKFANLMNEKAQEIGMKDTIFYNAHGLEERNGTANKSTAYDMALLTKVAMNNEIFRMIFATKQRIVKTNYKTYSWSNKNRLFYNYEYTTGGKTGYTELANRTLVTTATKDNKNLIIVTLNDGNDFANHKSLYEEYFSKYDLITILDPNNFVIKEEYYQDKLIIKKEYKLLLKEEELKNIKSVVELNKIKYPKDNEKVGVVKVYLNKELIHEEGIYIKKDNSPKESLWLKIWDFMKFWD